MTATVGEGGDRKDIAVCVDAVKTAGAVGCNRLLEEPSPNVGVAIHGKTLCAESEDLM